jgi:hypothetical protein
LSASSSLW